MSEIKRRTETDKRGSPKNLSNKRFGRLTAIEVAGRNERGNVVWKCKCDCGGIKVAETGSLIAENVQSCGCLHSETRAERTKRLNNFQKKELLRNGTNLSKLTNHPYKSTKSGIRGVSWQNSTGKWAVNITVGGVRKYLGAYTTVDKAAQVRKDAEERYFKPLLGKELQEKREWLNENVLTPKEAIVILDITKQAFSLAVQKGKITPFYDGGRSIRLYLLSEIKNYSNIRFQRGLKYEMDEKESMMKQWFAKNLITQKKAKENLGINEKYFCRKRQGITPFFVVKKDKLTMKFYLESDLLLPKDNIRKPLKINVYPDDRFGSWLVIREVEKSHGCRMIECRCDCGEIKNVALFNLWYERSKSCRSCFYKRNKG